MIREETISSGAITKLGSTKEGHLTIRLLEDEASLNFKGEPYTSLFVIEGREISPLFGSAVELAKYSGQKMDLVMEFSGNKPSKLRGCVGQDVIFIRELTA